MLQQLAGVIARWAEIIAINDVMISVFKANIIA